MIDLGIKKANQQDAFLLIMRGGETKGQSLECKFTPQCLLFFWGGGGRGRVTTSPSASRMLQERNGTVSGGDLGSRVDPFKRLFSD